MVFSLLARLGAGYQKLYTTVVAGTPANAGNIPQLGADGFLDNSTIHPSLVPAPIALPAAVAIQAGSQVNIFNNPVATTTASAASTAASVTVASATGIAAGQSVSATGVPAGTLVAPSYTPGSTTVPLTQAVNVANNAALTFSAESVQLADATTNPPLRSDGYVTATVAKNAVASVYRRGGINTGVTGLVQGADYFLGAAGAATTTQNTTVGQLDQYLGIATSATTLDQLPPQPAIGN